MTWTSEIGVHGKRIDIRDPKGEVVKVLWISVDASQEDIDAKAKAWIDGEPYPEVTGTGS